MRAVTKKHLSVRDGKAQFAQVTVALLESEVERVRQPELFFGDRRVVHLAKDHLALFEAAANAVRQVEYKHGVLLCLKKVECVEVDAHPEAVRLATLSAIQELLVTRQ